MKTETPESEAAWNKYIDTGNEEHLYVKSQTLETERNRLREAIIKMRDAKGRHHTELACNELFELVK